MLRAPAVCANVASAGVDREGRPKFRAVDDFTRSLMNAATAASEKLRCDTLDTFHATLRMSVVRMGVCVAHCGVRRLRCSLRPFCHRLTIRYGKPTSIRLLDAYPSALTTDLSDISAFCEMAMSWLQNTSR